ncbi:MAG: hypothetical protein U1C74_09180 [Phenylobacterium sp.]|nr:hypothetical protein [Phenylobacterium sp.]
MDFQPTIEPPAVIRVAAITGNAFKKLEEGMSKDRVIAILGKPDGFTRNGNVEVLTYRNRMMSGWSWDRADYYVVLTEGRITSYGTGEVREREAPVISIPPQSYSAPASAPASEQCFFQREWTSGFYKNCVYRCVAGEVVKTVGSAEMCALTGSP